MASTHTSTGVNRLFVCHCELVVLGTFAWGVSLALPPQHDHSHVKHDAPDGALQHILVIYHNLAAAAACGCGGCVLCVRRC